MRVIRKKFNALRSTLNERQRRLWAATEAVAIGRGGIACVGEATGLSRNTIRAGTRELKERKRRALEPQRVRRRGGGRKPLAHHDPDLPDALNALIEPTTRGDPESPLRWTCKRTRKLAAELTRQGHSISREGVARTLKAQKYSLQANRKTLEGKQHPDRNAQFEYINERVMLAQRRKQPVISVDTKKKELVGRFKNAGREWRPSGEPEDVDVHDFIDPELGKVIPYGVYDFVANNGWVSVGIDHDTAAFAVATIRRWWLKMGKRAYPRARELTITADSGGSNSYRGRAWKVDLQGFADETGLRLRVSHFPPATSKWNKNRASSLLSYLQELAREAIGDPSGRRGADRQHNHNNRPSGSCRARHSQLSNGPHNHRRGTRKRQHTTRRVPWRMELPHCSTPMIILFCGES